MRWHRSHVIRTALLASTTLTPAALLIAAQAQTHHQVTVNDPRPLAAVIIELEQRYGWTITYEDPPYEFAADAEDVTGAVRRDFRNDSRSRVLVPRGGPFTFDYDSSNTSPDPMIALGALLHSYHQAFRGTTFRVIRTATAFHVLPDESLDKGGNVRKHRSLLDTRIMSDEQPRTALAMLQLITRAVSLPDQPAVVVGNIPINLLANTQVRASAMEKPARLVLLDTLAATGAKLSWKLFCQPGVQQCALNVNQVPTH